jgi:hypothetical protein
MGPNSVTSIDPYFIRAPAAASCSLPSLTGITPHAVCAGGPGFTATLTGTGFLSSGNGRFRGASPDHVLSRPYPDSIPASDIASPGIALIDYLGAPPAGGLTGAMPVGVEPPAESTGSSLRVAKGGGNVALTWSHAMNASSYNVRRCLATTHCTPATIATPIAQSYADPVLGDGASYWYLIDSVNSCGAVP